MTAILLKGQRLCNQIILELNEQITSDVSSGLRPPHLEAILVGDDKASAIYVNNKHKACKKAGITTNTLRLDSKLSEQQLIEHILSLNSNPLVDGILVQLPLPSYISSQSIIETISINKDVDGFHPYNVGRLSVRKPHLRPCTPYGIMMLLAEYKIEPRGKDVTIVGVSNIVGRPLGLEMLLAGASVTACHSQTQSLKKHIEQAEIVVSATGVLDIINPDWIRKDAIVIDVGIHRLDNRQLRGDLDFEALKEKVAYITPVPGGVGPMTVAALLKNTYQAYALTHKKSLPGNLSSDSSQLNDVF